MTTPPEVLALARVRTRTGPSYTPPAAEPSGAPSQASSSAGDFPRELYAGKDAAEFLGYDAAATAAAGPVPLPGASVTIPDNKEGYVRALALYVADLVAGSQLFAVVTVNGNPHPAYGRIPIFPRAAAFASLELATFIHVPRGGTVAVRFQNADGGAYRVGALVVGHWQSPEA